MNLADMGADVLRVISGSRPDMVALGPPFIPGTDISFSAAFVGRGKRCMTLNLKDPRAVRIIHGLISDYDILIEQFRPGVMDNLGFGYAALRKVNPALIYCSLTGYGQTGPHNARAGHDINFLARSGVMSYSGKQKEGPSLMGIPIAAVASGSANAVIGILASVISRHTTGRGQHIDISINDGVIAFNILAGNAFLVDGKEPGREEHFLNGGCVCDFYETGDGEHISFGGMEQKFFAAFCEAIGRPDLIQGGIFPDDVRETKRQIREIILTKNRDEWMGIFNKTDACVDPVLSLSEALTDDHAKERELVVEVDLPTGGTVRQIANPIKFSETCQEYKTAGVSAGTHTREVMFELGYTDDDINRFEKEGLFS
jgi:crotonobetainyl-CoA:carnitine CoA-transferase CaiB-like acyl-CoA transferase